MPGQRAPTSEERAAREAAQLEAEQKIREEQEAREAEKLEIERKKQQKEKQVETRASYSDDASIPAVVGVYTLIALLRAPAFVTAFSCLAAPVALWGSLISLPSLLVIPLIAGSVLSWKAIHEVESQNFFKDLPFATEKERALSYGIAGLILAGVGTGVLFAFSGAFPVLIAGSFIACAACYLLKGMMTYPLPQDESLSSLLSDSLSRWFSGKGQTASSGEEAASTGNFHEDVLGEKQDFLGGAAASRGSSPEEDVVLGDLPGEALDSGYASGY